MEANKIYKRRDDMSAVDTLELLMEPDGDIIIAIKKPGIGMAMNVQFCSLSNGDGRSKHTRTALINLAKAIERDNKEKPLD